MTCKCHVNHVLTHSLSFFDIQSLCFFLPVCLELDFTCAEDGVAEQHIVEHSQHCAEHRHNTWSSSRHVVVCVVRTRGVWTDGR